MLPFRRILFPVDYSEPCLAVVPYVKDLLRHSPWDSNDATQQPANLTLIHAYGPEALAYSELPMADPDLPSQAQAIQEEKLDDFAARMFPAQHVTCVTACGEPGSAIHALVQHQSTDLVMLPTHGRGPVRRFLLGSVTAKVLHDVSAAVWTGTGAAFAGHLPMLPYRSILCALDGTPEAECVLRAAQTFAGMYGAALSLLSVLEPMPASEFDMTPYQQDRIEAARFHLRELTGTVGVDAPHQVIESPIADGVRQEALRLKADLVITGRGHSQGVFTTLRSHLYQLIRESPCPVLSI
jgi:nucleotide-binding universal stress UspA family protein